MKLSTLAAVGLLVLTTYSTLIQAADCTQTQALTCTTTGGFSITDVTCLATDPGTCGQGICNVAKWTAVATCLAAVPCTLTSTTSCQATYQVCNASTITALCGSATATTTAAAPGTAVVTVGGSTTAAATTAPAPTSALLHLTCTSSAQAACMTTAGFSQSDLFCMSGSASSCTTSVCDTTKWQTFGTCSRAAGCPLTYPAANESQIVACALRFFSCSQGFITTMCSPRPKSSGTLRLSGTWNSIVASATSLESVKAALRADLARRFGQAVIILSVTVGSLIVQWETEGGVEDPAAFKARAEASTGSSSWLTSTQSAYTTNGGSGSVEATSVSATGSAKGVHSIALAVFATVVIALLSAL